MEIIGKVYKVGEIEMGKTKEEKQWVRMTVVIETTDSTPRKVAFKVSGQNTVEDVSELKLQPGEIVSAKFDVRSREWEGKWFTELNAWSFKRATL